jgi:hypothetical protein
VDRALQVLNEKLNEDIRTRQAALHGGACLTFDAYKELVGVLRGLTLAQQHLHDLANAMEHDDE